MSIFFLRCGFFLCARYLFSEFYSYKGHRENLSEFYSYRVIGKTDRFFTASGVQSTESNMGPFFHFRCTAFSSIVKPRVSSILTKTTVLRIDLNLDGAPITSKSHTHPLDSQTSRLLTSSLSLGVPVPRPTQCIRVV
jgi:hypothetical protein